MAGYLGGSPAHGLDHEANRHRSRPFGSRDNWPMPQLVPPDPRLRASFAGAMDEFRAEGRGVAGDQSEIGHYLRDRQDAWSSDEAFQAFAEEIRALRLEETPRPDGYVPA